MIFSYPRSWWDDLFTIPRYVVSTFTLFTISVSNVVRILLVKSISGNFLCEFWFPKMQTFFKRKTNSFQKQSILQSAIMLQMVISSQGRMKREHARWEMLFCHKVNVFKIYFSMYWDIFFWRVLEVNKVFLRNVFKQVSHSDVFCYCAKMILCIFQY